jgi:CRISPR/Cas system CMR subunit Cmr4 (Cas7 group RAMP superfamily)
MKLTAGLHLLRLEAMAPVHLGSVAGEATLHRPCQKDSLWGLPFVPDSALKGVWAGTRGNVEAEKPNRGREDVFGSPDRGGTRGKPAPLTVGNGELLCFPMPVTDGPPVWVFPALSLARLLRLDPGAKEGKGFPGTIGQIESSRQSLVFASPALPRSEALSGFQPVIGASAMSEAASLKARLLHYAGASMPEDASFLLVANHHARRLWLAAADRRTLTAMTENRTVDDGTLRDIELIPPGTVFISLLTCDRDVDNIPWPALLQMGGWEGLGFGWMKPTLVSGQAAAPGEAEVESQRAARIPNEPDVMVEMHRAVQSLESEPVELLKAIKSAVGNFGPRAQFSGLEAALAFELAKAKPRNTRPGKDARAHRWLLSALLLSARSPRENEPMPEAVTWLEGDPFEASWISAHRDQLFLRWQWLRRFVEYGIEA